MRRETAMVRTDIAPRNPPTVVEKHTTVVPGSTVTERKTDKTVTEEDD